MVDGIKQCPTEMKLFFSVDIIIFSRHCLKIKSKSNAKRFQKQSGYDQSFYACMESKILSIDTDV